MRAAGAEFDHGESLAGARREGISRSSIVADLQRSLNEDGFYVVAGRRLRKALGLFRNYMIARKLGVRQVEVGRHSTLRGLQYVQLGEDFVALDGFWLHAISQYGSQQFIPRIIIGNRVRVSQWVHIAATHHVEIGDDVLIGSKVIITDHNHGQYSAAHTSPDVAPSLRPLDADRQVVIGKNVWLGDGVAVASGATIGEGSVIGANSVVMGHIPKFSLAAGAPARVIKIFDFSLKKWVPVERRV